MAQGHPRRTKAAKESFTRVAASHRIAASLQIHSLEETCGNGITSVRTTCTIPTVKEE